MESATSKIKYVDGNGNLSRTANDADYDWYNGVNVAEYFKMKEQKVKNRDCQRQKRALKKTQEGLDPTMNRRAHRRKGETGQEYLKRMEYNRSCMERGRLKKKQINDGTWKFKLKVIGAETVSAAGTLRTNQAHSASPSNEAVLEASDNSGDDSVLDPNETVSEPEDDAAVAQNLATQANMMATINRLQTTDTSCAPPSGA